MFNKNPQDQLLFMVANHVQLIIDKNKIQIVATEMRLQWILGNKKF